MNKRTILTPTNLMKQKWSMDMITSDFLKLPFKVDARTYLDFAKEDIKDDCMRGDINAITNIKRAIENRLDGILFLFGYYEVATDEKWSFPRKVSVLTDLGIKAPRILQKRINLQRVMVEHKYEKPPKHEDLCDLVDVAELFLEATDKFLESPVSHMSASVNRGGLIETYMIIEFGIGEGKMNVEIYGPDPNNRPGHFGALKRRFSSTNTSCDYADWLRFVIQLVY